MVFLPWVSLSFGFRSGIKGFSSLKYRLFERLGTWEGYGEQKMRKTSKIMDFLAEIATRSGRWPGPNPPELPKGREKDKTFG